MHRWNRPNTGSNRRRLHNEHGFTLIELLVVILIIGILAAIAIPSFLNQKSKATDASAKELVRSAETVAETIANDSNGGSYAPLSVSKEVSFESSINTNSGNGAAWLIDAAPDASHLGYHVTVASISGNTYTVTRNDDGTYSRTCTPATGLNGGCNNGNW